MPLNLPIPEDFGAIGDGLKDDTEALNKFFNSWQASGSKDSVSLALNPRSLYAFSEPLTLTNGTLTKGFKLVFNGNGAGLVYTGGFGKGYALRLGSQDKDNNGYWCSFRDLYLQANNGADGLFLIDYTDFLRLDQIRCNASVEEAIIRCNRNVSMNCDSLFISGGRQAKYGMFFGQTNSNNVFTWKSGKVMNTQIGIQYTGGTFTVDNVDCSLNSEACAVLNRASNGEFGIYSEKVGPKQSNNRAACYRIIDSNNITLKKHIKSQYGGVKDNTHAAYGVDIVNSHNIYMDQVIGYLPQKMLVNIDDKSYNIVLSRGSGARSIAGSVPTAQPCPISDGVRFINEAATFLSDENKGIAVNGLPTTLTFSSKVGKCALEMRARILSYDDPEKTFTVLEARIDSDGIRTTHSGRLGPGWQDFRFEFESNGVVNILLRIASGCDPANIKFDFVRVV